MSHGHFDHFGGLPGFLEKHRAQLPADQYLIDRQGKYIGIFPPGTHYDRMARMLRVELKP